MQLRNASSIERNKNIHKPPHFEQIFWEKTLKVNREAMQTLQLKRKEAGKPAQRPPRMSSMITMSLADLADIKLLLQSNPEFN